MISVFTFFSSYLSRADLLFSTNSLEDWSSFPTFTLVIPAEDEDEEWNP